MVLFRRKPVPLLYQPGALHDDQEVWVIDQTNEVFVNYEAYLQRVDFYRQKKFICEITGHSGLSFFEAFQSEVDASDEVDDAFPDALKEPILRRVQFSTISRLDHLVDHVFEEFKHDFYPGEHILVTCGDGSRAPAVIREKTKFPELRNKDGSLDRASFARYFVCFDSLPDQESVVDTADVARDRKTFTKQRLRSFLKKTVDHEPWSGAPWCVKIKIAEEYRISVKIPHHLTYESQIAQRKANMAMKNGDYEGQLLNFPSNLPQLKPKGQKAKNGNQDLARLSNEYQRALAANPDFSKIPQAVQQQQIEQMIHNANGFPPFTGFQPIAAKGKPKPPPPPPPKYPIEDLELPPANNGVTRPPMKFLSAEIPTYEHPSESREAGIMVQSVGPLLETWDTLNVYCEVFQLDSFTFDNYVESLQLGTNILHCDLVVEIHCAILKKLVNDSNDKNGQIQFSLPEPAAGPDSETTSNADNSNIHTPIPEPEVRSSGRTTRSSLAKVEAAEMRESNKTGEPSTTDLKIHRAAEMVQTTSGNDWKNRLRKRDLSEGKWVFIIVGLLYQLSGDTRRKNACDDILARLAPLDQDPVPETAISQYATVDINTRVRILEIICMLSLETKAIRNYMEECNNHMTETRKERIEVQRSRKAAMEELRVLHEERKALQPESKSPSPIPDVEEFEDSKMGGVSEDETEEAEANGDATLDTEEEEPHRGRSLRRANDRAAQRKRKLEAEKERKERAQAEKTKKPSKQEKQYEKILKKIEEVKENIIDLEEEVATLENDLREADCPRTRVLGKDRFWNRYFWFERNAMPYGGLPDSSTADAGYANGCLWVQGPDDMERRGFIELSHAENAQYHRAFNMTVPDRKMFEEGTTHVFNARQWGYYDDPEQLDMLIGWLDTHGVREAKLRKELQAQRDKISTYMIKRKEYLALDDDKKSESGEPTTRISTRKKTYADPSPTQRCFAWKNLTAERENGHFHADPKPPSSNKRQAKGTKKIFEDEGRQTRATNRQGKPLTRQGSRYIF